jgi:hypothetical protein
MEHKMKILRLFAKIELLYRFCSVKEPRERDFAQGSQLRFYQSLNPLKLKEVKKTLRKKDKLYIK